MKLPKFDLKNVKVGDVELPGQFAEPVRADVIHRAVLVLQANARQRYGAAPRAGFRHATEISRRRRKYKGSYGQGISRVPRKILSHHGTRFNWVGALAPGTVGGRRAHPPKAAKIWELKVNKKENRKAIRSAMAASLDRALVAAHGFRLPSSYPFVVDKSIESLKKTSDVHSALLTFGFEQELARSAIKKVRAGRGKGRGRRYKQRTGLLLVVGADCPLLNAARNLPGLDVVPVHALNAELLAPGAQPGRAALFTEAAIDALKSKKLFS